MTFALFEGLVRQNEEQIQFKLTDQQLKHQLEHYEDLTENHKSIRRIWHNMKNHLLCIQAFVHDKKYDMVDSYITELDFEVNGSMTALTEGL